MANCKKCRKWVLIKETTFGVTVHGLSAYHVTRTLASENTPKGTFVVSWSEYVFYNKFQSILRFIIAAFNTRQYESREETTVSILFVSSYCSKQFCNITVHQNILLQFKNSFCKYPGLHTTTFSTR